MAREGQHAAVEADRVDARHAAAAERVEALHAGRGDQQAGQPARAGEQERLGEELPHQPGGAGADGGADRHLAAPADGAGEQEVRDVGAGDEQHEADGADEDPQRTADLADDLLAQRHDAERQLPVGRIDGGMLAAEARRQRVHPRLGRRGRDAGRQAREDVVVLARADRRRVGPERQRQQQLRLLGAAERRQHVARQREAGRQHADDAIGDAVHDQRPADGGRIPAVAPQPGAVRQQRRAGGAGAILVGGEQAAEGGTDAEHRQQVRRHPDRADAFRLAAAGQVVVAADGERDVGEGAGAADVEVLRGREPVLGDAQARRSVPEDDEAIGIGVGQRAEEQRAGDAEDRGVGADAERQRQDGGDGHTRRGRQRAPGVSQILANPMAPILSAVCGALASVGRAGDGRRSALLGALWAAPPVTVSGARSRMLSDDAPTPMSKTPGSTADPMVPP